MQPTVLDEEESTTTEPPFSADDRSGIESDVDIAIDALMPIRMIYEPEVLQALARQLPRYLALENQAVILECTSEGVYLVGMSDPLNAVAVRNIVRALKIHSNKLIPRFVAPARLSQLQQTAYEQRQDSLATEDFEDLQTLEPLRTTLDWNSLDENAAAGTTQQEFAEPQIEIGVGTSLRAMAEKIILEAIRRRASDIHLMPGEGVGMIRARTDGSVYTIYENIPAARMENLANAFSDMAGVNAYELTQRGRAAEISLSFKDDSGRKKKKNLRFHGTKGYYGKNIVIRINSAVFRNFDQIGLEPSQQQEIQTALNYRNGVILVTGPTGSGKSNTLEAMLRSLEETLEFSKNIVQIGNPIEFPNPKRNQRPVDGAESWAEALEDTLRMDPDIFSPGEFKTAEEAKIVFEASTTGHLTLTTVHTNNVEQTFSRLDFLKIARDKQGNLIRLIVSQELVPLLCQHCRQPDRRGREIAEQLLDVVFPNRPDLKASITKAEGQTPFFKKAGCPACNYSGKKGRTCIAELLHVTPDIGRMLRRNIDSEQIVDYAIRRGMITLAEAAARKLCRGIISYDDVKHLLISANQAAPEAEQPVWETSYDDNPAAQHARGDGMRPTDATPDDCEEIIGEVIDVEYTVPPTSTQSQNTHHASAAGFSMIELMIVVVVLSIVAAIAIPNLIASRRAAYEATAKQKLAAMGQQETAFKTLLGKRRYGTMAELQAATAGGSPLLTASDSTVTGWTFSDHGAGSCGIPAQCFGFKVVPAAGNPANYSFFIAEDQTVRRCPLAGPWTKSCNPTDQ